MDGRTDVATPPSRPLPTTLSHASHTMMLGFTPPNQGLRTFDALDIRVGEETWPSLLCILFSIIPNLAQVARFASIIHE